MEMTQAEVANTLAIEYVSQRIRLLRWVRWLPSSARNLRALERQMEMLNNRTPRLGIGALKRKQQKKG